MEINTVAAQLAHASCPSQSYVFVCGAGVRLMQAPFKKCGTVLRAQTVALIEEPPVNPLVRDAPVELPGIWVFRDKRLRGCEHCKDGAEAEFGLPFSCTTRVGSDLVGLELCRYLVLNEESSMVK